MTNLRVSATGAAAVALSYTVPTGAIFDLNSVTIKFSAAPVSAESLTITLDSALGAAYDAVLYKVDPSATVGDKRCVATCRAAVLAARRHRDAGLHQHGHPHLGRNHRGQRRLRCQQ